MDWIAWAHTCSQPGSIVVFVKVKRNSINIAGLSRYPCRIIRANTAVWFNVLELEVCFCKVLSRHRYVNNTTGIFEKTTSVSSVRNPIRAAKERGILALARQRPDHAMLNPPPPGTGRLFLLWTLKSTLRLPCQTNMHLGMQPVLKLRPRRVLYLLSPLHTISSPLSSRTCYRNGSDLHRRSNRAIYQGRMDCHPRRSPRFCVAGIPVITTSRCQRITDDELDSLWGVSCSRQHSGG